MSFLPQRSDLSQITSTISDAASAAATRSAYASSVSDAPPLSPTGSSNKKRGSSRMTSGKQIARSISTPQMRDAPMSDSEADKKRNKLGYQRISIACAHCRRRKIRCLLAEGDPQQRCQNCIRLRKECVFYPVDQQAAMENRTDVSVKQIPGSGPPSVVSSSPTSSILDRPIDPPRDFSGYSSLPSRGPTTFQGLPLEPGSALPAQGTFRPPNLEYRQEHVAQQWNSPQGFEMVSNAIAPGAESAIPVTHGSTLSGDFSPFPNNDYARSTSFNHHSFDFPQSRDESWQYAPTTRSMSYGHIESLQGSNTAYATEFNPTGAAHPSALRYPPGTIPHDPHNMTQPSGAHSLPTNAAMQPFVHGHEYAIPQDQNNSGTFPMIQHQGFPNGWYPPQPSFAALAEEPETYGSAQSRPG